MSTKIFLTLGTVALTVAFTGCGSTATNTANTANTANKANTTATNSNANTAANTAANTTATNTNSNTSSAAASGDVLKIDEAGIMMTVPKGFKFSKDGDDTVVKTEDEGVDVRFTVPKDGDYEKIVNDAVKELDDYLKDVKVTEPAAKETVSGMEATSLSGTAKDEDGEDVLWNLTIINAPKKPVLANIYAEKGSLEKHGAAVKAFLESVKKQ
jgi:hypothetical protein